MRKEQFWHNTSPRDMTGALGWMLFESTIKGRLKSGVLWEEMDNQHSRSSYSRGFLLLICAQLGPLGMGVILEEMKGRVKLI